jgi:hypothetical protein
MLKNKDESIEYDYGEEEKSIEEPNWHIISLKIER